MNAKDTSELRQFIQDRIGYIDPEDDCWYRKDKIGNKTYYDSIRYEGKVYRIHILAAVAYLNHDNRTNLYICHKCDHKSCFNPDHLFIGTPSDNHRDAIYKFRKHKSVEEYYQLGGIAYIEFRTVFANRLRNWLDLIYK